MTDSMVKRVLKYLIPVIVLSILFNIPKFFEAKVVWTTSSSSSINDDAMDDKNGTLGTTTYSSPSIGITDLRRKNAFYSSYNAWSRLFVLGLIPFILLVFFNVKIYKDISERKRRRFRNQPANTSVVNQESEEDISDENNVVVTREEAATAAATAHDNRGFSNSFRLSDKRRKFWKLRSKSGDENDEEQFPMRKVVTKQNHGERLDVPVQIIINDVDDKSMTSSNNHISNTTTVSTTAVLTVPPSQTVATTVAVTTGTSTSSLTYNKLKSKTIKNNSIIKARRHKTSSNERRRILEDNLAMVFMGFIFVFLLCHVLRVFLNVHELAVWNSAIQCQKAKKRMWKPWSIAMISMSHLLLAINAATNMPVSQLGIYLPK